MGLWTTYRLRIRRKRLLLRARRKGRALRPVQDNTARIRPGDLLVFCCLRNEAARLPQFLSHYRAMGVDHFVIVDNGSTDASPQILAEGADISVWRTEAGYKAARFGMDWMTHLLHRVGRGHWCLTVDPDELLIYPFHDSRPLRALTDWLGASGARAFPAMLLDLYPKGPVEAPAPATDDVLTHLCWYDAGNYRLSRNWAWDNLWIQGGPRERVLFADRPEQAPALNKIPLVRWERGFVYASSTHALLPRGLNRVYDETGRVRISGLLLHTKFMPGFAAKAKEELTRRQHYGNSREYQAYAEGLASGTCFWTSESTRLSDWRDLAARGLMSTGPWG